MNNLWDAFSTSGNIEAYLAYKQFCKEDKREVGLLDEDLMQKFGVDQGGDV